MTVSSHPHVGERRASPNRILAVVLTGYFLLLLDISIVNTGLPDIRRSMALSPVALTWVQNAYLLCFGGLLLLGARAGDLYGRKRMLLAGVAIFTLASLGVGAAANAPMLIVSRALQGVGAAILAPSVLSIIAVTFPDGPQRTRALALYSMVAGAGASVGLTLGGLFADLVSWRVGFLINVPIGVLLLFIASRELRETPRHGGRFDVVGALSSMLGMISLVYGVVRAAEAGWSDPLALGCVVTAGAVLAGFVVQQRRAADPILPLSLFASAERSAAYLARMLFVGSVVGFFFFTTQLMQEVLGFSPLQAGLGFLPMTLTTFAAAMMVPRLAVRIGGASLASVSFLALAFGMFWLGRAGVGADYWRDVALPMMIIGLGNGAVMGPLTMSGVRGVSERHQGAASGVVNVAHQIGGSLGLSALIVAYAAASVPIDLGPSAALAARIQIAATGGALMNVIALATVAGVLLPIEIGQRRLARRPSDAKAVGPAAR